MGCSNSKPNVCQKCKSHYSPVHHINSMHKENNSNHLVALTSSTLGSLRLDPLNQTTLLKGDRDEGNINKEMGLIEAKTWSQMVNEKIPKVIPKTPITTPPGEPESVNVWELMEDLEDIISPVKQPHHAGSFSFHVFPSTCDQLTPRLRADYERSYQQLLEVKDEKIENGEVREYKLLQYDKYKLVLYFTSLRGVRKTYEDCCHVRMILKGLSVKIDERDVSMHAGFKEELKDLIGEEYRAEGLPRVFLGRNYIGGVDEICRMHEDGQLEKVVESCERVEYNGVCEVCADIRFVPCETCYGSCKIYYEADYDEEEFEEEDYGFQRCPDCNENGLMRCPICCD